DVWLRQRKPLFDTQLFKSAGLAPPEFLVNDPKPDGDGQHPNARVSGASTAVAVAPAPATPVTTPQPKNPARTEAHQPQSAATAPQGVPEAERPSIGSTQVRDIPVARRYERDTLG